MPKRRYIADDESGDDGYAQAQCPECEAILAARFGRGRRARRLHCPVCKNLVTVSPLKEEPQQTLIQLKR